MSKKVVVISASLRTNSNSAALAEQFAKGAKDAGNEVEVISLKGKNIGFCIGCLACQGTGSCVIKDDADEITQKVLNADVVAWATPIYYYEMSSQLKTLLDRLNPLYSADYAFREIYMIATAAEEEETAFDKAYHGLQGWVDCFEKAELKGIVAGGGIDAAHAAISHDDVMKKAYRLGLEL